MYLFLEHKWHISAKQHILLPTNIIMANISIIILASGLIAIGTLKTKGYHVDNCVVIGGAGSWHNNQQCQ